MPKRRPERFGQFAERIPPIDYWSYFTPYPGLPATDLIARVYEAFSRRNWRFYFSYFFGDALFTYGLREHIRVHFYLPDLNIAVIVKGGYWYDKGSNVQETALDMAMLEYAGIRPILWTEEQVMYWGIDELIRREPLLQGPMPLGGPIPTDYEPFDYRAMVMVPGRPLKRERYAVYPRRRRPKR